MYRAPGQGQTVSLGTNFDVNRLPISLCLFVASFEKNLSEVRFIHILHIAKGPGQTTPLGQNDDVNRKPLSLCPYVARFKIISSKSDFIHVFLMILYIFLASEQGQTTPWG